MMRYDACPTSSAPRSDQCSVDTGKSVATFINRQEPSTEAHEYPWGSGVKC